MSIKTAALCINASGEPEFIYRDLDVSSEQQENGDHFDLIEQVAVDDGYQFVKAFDLNDYAAKQLADLKEFFGL
ncbi:hypothetical protein ACRCPS_18320 [Pseudomonas aeruginosa]